jgi:hypothetical protein
MSITQERLMRIINAADHVKRQYEALHKEVKELYLLEDLRDYLNRKERLGNVLFSTELSPDHLMTLQTEIAHFRVHFKRNHRRATLTRLRRANGGQEVTFSDEEIINEYFNKPPSVDELIEQSKERNKGEAEAIELELESQSHEICPSCGVQATFFEKEKHLDSCEYKNEARSEPL